MTTAPLVNQQILQSDKRKKLPDLSFMIMMVQIPDRSERTNLNVERSEGKIRESHHHPTENICQKAWITRMEMMRGLEKVGRDLRHEKRRLRQEQILNRLNMAATILYFSFRFQPWIQGFFWNLLLKKKITFLNSHSHTIQN